MMMQTFALSDLPKVAVLSFLELLLSADNAVVLGMLAHSLPPPLRRRALYIGVISSFFFRAAALLLASYLLHYSWIQLIGAAYLLYLSIHHFFKKVDQANVSLTRHSFWKTVLLIEFFDLAFAIDSIVAGIAFVGPTDASIHPKLWIVYVGGMIGLVLVRYAADLFSNLIDSFPHLATSAYLLIGWIGIELGINGLGAKFPPLLFWSGTVLLLSLGFLRKK